MDEVRSEVALKAFRDDDSEKRAGGDSDDGA